MYWWLSIQCGCKEVRASWAIPVNWSTLTLTKNHSLIPRLISSYRKEPAWVWGYKTQFFESKSMYKRASCWPWQKPFWFLTIIYVHSKQWQEEWSDSVVFWLHVWPWLTACMAMVWPWCRSLSYLKVTISAQLTVLPQHVTGTSSGATSKKYGWPSRLNSVVQWGHS